MPRTKLMAGNWKMHTTAEEARALAAAIRDGAEGAEGVGVLLCPPYTAIPAVAEELSASPIKLGAQNVFYEEKGAFTGAERTFRGAFERAENGTIFLDELGELPLSMQPKLLRALDQMKVRRLGSDVVRPIGARFVAATNRDLVSMVNDGPPLFSSQSSTKNSGWGSTASSSIFKR